MIDLLKLSVPFKPEHLIVVKSADELGGVYVDLEKVAKQSGLRLSARSVEYAIDGDLTVTGLNHPFDSLPTYYTGLAMKIYGGTFNRHPCVELKASPAKLLQGHNVFGSTDLFLCGTELLANLGAALPELYDMLDVSETVIDRVDVTFSARVDSCKQAEQVILALRNVSNGQTKRTRSQDWETTCMWNEGSRHRVLIAYLKYPELIKQLESLKRFQKKSPHDMSLNNCIRAMSSPDLHEFSKNLVRFEARLKQRFLGCFGIPSKFIDAVNYQHKYETNGACLISDLWSHSFRDLFSALEGSTMNIYSDDEVMEVLKTKFYKITPKGNVSYSKAQRIFGFYRRIVNEGYDNVLNTLSRSTFYDNLNNLLSVGFSKAQLQNLFSEKHNVVPLIQLINVDFSNQRPVWYVEPISVFDRKNVYQFKVA